MRLPENPTTYDYLILSLREKDVIASFNWDPFLVQAYQRNRRRSDVSRPQLLFLHGNVAIGYCESDETMGIPGKICKKCNRAFKATQLLFPIKEKNYQTAFLSLQWDALLSKMQSASILTIYGYSAPRSDVEAIKLMKSAWGCPDIEQFEMINITPELELTATWKDFIHSHHYDYSSDFFDSLLGKYPRRTVESFVRNVLDIDPVANHPAPRTSDFDELWEWHESLAANEEK
jgi:hypothetical protein